MKELALYVLDLAQNSVVAGAKHITIDITADVKADHLLIRIVDDGKGMSPHLVERVTDPFFTSRKERRFGLGIPFFKDLVEQCGGTLTIKSKEGEGTIIEGKLKLSSVDLVPLGDMGSTIVSLLVSNPELNLVYRFTLNDYSFTFDSAQIREVLQGVNITEPSVLNWIKDYVNEGSIEILPNINISKKEGAKRIMKQIKTLEDLQKIREEALRKVNIRSDRSGTRITVGMATCGIAAGARPVMMAILDELEKRNVTGVTVVETGCIGLCKFEPIVEVYVPGHEKVTYIKMDPDKARQVVVEHVINGHPIREWTLESAELE